MTDVNAEIEPVAHDQPLKLAHAARYYWGISGVVVCGIWMAVVAAVFLTFGYGVGGVFAALVFVLFSAWWWIVTDRRYNAWTYQEFDRELVLTRGIWIRRVTVVPYGRMQFVDVFQGPIDRWLGVSTVKLHTAAAATDATIPFVDQKEADRLRKRLTELGESFAAGL